jgi:hypothetical protein
VIENTARKLWPTVLVHILLFVSVQGIFHEPRVYVPSLDFLELSHRLGNSAGEFWTHFLIYQRKANHTIHLMKWFSGELPEVSI